MSPPRMPRDLADFDCLTRAEFQLLCELGTGHVVRIGDGRVPPVDGGPDVQVRASLVRWLALGAPGDDELRLHEHGLRIAGALIASDGEADPLLGPESTPGLDVEGCRLDRDLLLLGCRFEHAPVLRQASGQTFNFQRSHLPGLLADGLRAEGSVFLRQAQVTGELFLLGARIGGDLDCKGAKLSNKDRPALNADGLRAEGGVFLRQARVTGEVRLFGARIGGNLACVGATLSNKDGKALYADGLRAEDSVFLRQARVTGEVRLVGARIGGDLICEGAKLSNDGGDALSADSAGIEGTFFWRQGASIWGVMDLSAAEIGAICDDPACWPTEAGSLVLDRSRYGAFIGPKATTDARKRIEWLALQDHETLGTDFLPSAWEQCAKVLREMGHPEDAREILIDKERRQRADRRRRETDALVRLWYEITDGLLGAVVRYGHRPLRAARFLLALWAFGWAVFASTWQAGGFKPNNAFVLRSPEWVRCGQAAGEPFDAALPDATETSTRLTGLRTKGHRSQLGCFLDQPESRSYPEFHAGVYAADVLLPIVEIEQQANWIPDEDRAPGAKAMVYLLVVAGWGLSLLAVAGFSGLVKI